MPGKTNATPLRPLLSTNQAELFSPSLAVTMEGLRDAGQPAQGWESQLCLSPVVTSTTGERNSSPCYEQDPMHSILPRSPRNLLICTQDPTAQPGGRHQLGQSNFLLQSPRRA